MQAAQRAQLQQFIALMNGGQHRVALRDFSYTPRGSITTTNLNPDPLVANYTTPTYLSLSNITGGLRSKRVNNSTNGDTIRPSTDATTAAASSYAHRSALRAYSNNQAYGRYAYISPGGSNNGGIFDSGLVTHATGIYVNGITAVGSSTRTSVLDNVQSNSSSQLDIIENSLARCFLVDNGVNSILQSQTFDNGSWTKTNSSITADASPYPTLAPNGSQTADELIEDSTASVTHDVRQSHTRTSAAEYWTASIYLKENTNQRILLRVDDGSSNGGQAYFDANLGTISTAAANVGTGANSYASIHSIGNGWYRCRISSKLPATTTARIIAFMCDGASDTTTYNGDGSSSVYIWGAQLQKGGQLGRYVATTTAAATEDSQTGNAIWLKGLDASTNGQLLAGDLIEINGQLLQLTADLDGDASGIGLAEVQPRIRTAPSDEDAAVLYRPQGRFLLANVSNGWANRPGIFSDMTLEFIEDITV